jgi:hypothetical protein
MESSSMKKPRKLADELMEGIEAMREQRRCKMSRDYENMDINDLIDIIEEQDFMIAGYEDDLADEALDEGRFAFKEYGMEYEHQHASRCSYWLWLDDPDNNEFCNCLLVHRNVGC